MPHDDTGCAAFHGAAGVVSDCTRATMGRCRTDPNKAFERSVSSAARCDGRIFSPLVVVARMVGTAARRVRRPRCLLAAARCARRVSVMWWGGEAHRASSDVEPRHGAAQRRAARLDPRRRGLRLTHTKSRPCCRTQRSVTTPVGDLEPAGGVHRLEHPAVVGDQQQRARVGGQRLLQLLDRGQVEVVGRLVEDQHVDARAPAAARARPGCARPARASRPAAARGRRSARTWPAGCAPRPSASRAPRRRTRRAAAPGRRTARGPGRSRRSAPTARGTPSPRRAAPGRAGRPAACDLPEPLAPVIASRSPQSTCRSTGPEREAAAAHDRAAQGGDDGAGARRGGDLQPQLPLLARLLDHLQPLDPPVGLLGLRRLLLRRRRGGAP